MCELLANGVFVKLPIDGILFDRASACLPWDERTWFNFARYTGYRLDETNRLEWGDLDLDKGEMVVPGTKNEGARALLPMAEVVTATLKIHKLLANPHCPLVFPGRDGSYIYERTWIFKMIEERTGIRLCTRNLRDYFCRETMKRVRDPGVGMRLLRHTNLKTTSLYITAPMEDMKMAVKDIGKPIHR